MPVSCSISTRFNTRYSPSSTRCADWIANWQPKSGWEPGAAFFVTGNYKLHSYHDFDELMAAVKHDLQEGLTYEFLVRVEQTGLYDRKYSMKVWESGTPEPAEWTIGGVETFSIDEAPATGSLYLNAHYFDVTFNDVTVTEIVGNDILEGGDGADVLLAAGGSAEARGRGEVDVFVGGDGADVFVVGDDQGAYYDDGLAGTLGAEDLAFVWDFEAGVDKVRLHGSSSDYALSGAPEGLPAGIAVNRIDAEGAQELVALLAGIDDPDPNDPVFALDGATFEYVTDAVA